VQITKSAQFQLQTVPKLVWQSARRQCSAWMNEMATCNKVELDAGMQKLAHSGQAVIFRNQTPLGRRPHNTFWAWGRSSNSPGLPQRLCCMATMQLQGSHRYVFQTLSTPIFWLT